MLLGQLAAVDLFAQSDAVRFVPQDSLGHAGVYDAPEFLAALDASPLGALFRDADVAEAFALARRRTAEIVRQWLGITDIARATDQTVAAVESTLARARLAFRREYEREGHR